MERLDRDALDRYITGGRYSAAAGLVTCPCGEQVAVEAETEYGTTTWSPEECPKCGRAFDGDEPWVDDEGPQPFDTHEEREDYYR
jgi:hypothetical protein